jgi:hypothetical protein
MLKSLFTIKHILVFWIPAIPAGNDIYHRSNAPRWNVAVDAPASSLFKRDTSMKHTRRWSIARRIPTRSVGTIKLL